MTVKHRPQDSSRLLGSACFFGVLSILITMLGCATPTYDARQSVESQLEPWTPVRKGLHPADLSNTPEARSPVDPVEHRGRSNRGGPIATTAFLYWRLYSSTVSRSMGETCRFSPSCSRFAVDAAREGPEGLILTFARLQRNHLDDGSYEHTHTGHLKDPTSNYFYWRSDLGLQAHRSTMPRHQAWYVFVEAARKNGEQSADE